MLHDYLGIKNEALTHTKTNQSSHYFLAIIILQPEDRQLLKEVGPKGDGDPDVVQDFIDEVCIINQNVML